MAEPLQPGIAPGSLTAWPPALSLLLECTHWPSTERDADRVRRLVCAGGIDWNQFLTLCDHHRVAPLVGRSLGSIAAELSDAVPATVLAALKERSARNALDAFRSLVETRRLCRILSEAGIAARVLKGVPLSQQIYGDPSLRSVGDIDLVIAPESAEQANALLTADGFRRSEPAARLTPCRRRFWLRHGKDFTYAPDRSGFEVDLHWRLFRNPHLQGGALADAPAEPVLLGDVELPALPLDRSLLYLCVHGALDGWFRFKSLVDVAAIWRSMPASQQDAVTGLARSHGVLAALAAALHLALELELLEPEAVPAAMQLQAGRKEARWILDYAHRQHALQSFHPTPQAVGSWVLKRYELGLGRGMAYRLVLLRRVLLRPRMWETIDLPDALFPLYAVLSPMEWLLFRDRKRRVDVREEPARLSRWKRWRAQSRSRRWLLVEACAALVTARCALAWLPVRWVFRWLESPVTGRAPEEASVVVENVRWAILTAARYGPLHFVCFPQALAAHALLRRRGIASTMHYGVRRSADSRMRAHTWLEVSNRTLLGGESAMLFAPIRSSGSLSKHSRL